MADLALIVVASVWGATFIMVKQAIENTPVFTFLFLRFTFAAIFLGLFNLARGEKISVTALKDGSVLGSALFLVFAFQTFGLKTTPASTTAFITGLYVVMTPLLSAAVKRVIPELRVIIAVFIAFTGMALMTLQDRIYLTTGEFLVLICAFFCAVHILLTDPMSKRNTSFMLTMVQVSVVALYSMIFCLIFNLPLVKIQFDKDLVTALVVTSILATVFAFWTQTWAQKFTSPNHTAIIFTVEPLAAALFSYLLGEKPLTPVQYLGGALIFSAMLLVVIPDRRKPVK